MRFGAFCYAKQRNVMFAKGAPDGAGDIWTWVAIDAETKLVPSWRIGDRSGATATEFVCDLSRRLANRVQSHNITLRMPMRRFTRLDGRPFAVAQELDDAGIADFPRHVVTTDGHRAYLESR
jgi:hypothetical protein